MCDVVCNENTVIKGGMIVTDEDYMCDDEDMKDKYTTFCVGKNHAHVRKLEGKLSTLHKFLIRITKCSYDARRR